MLSALQELCIKLWQQNHLIHTQALTLSLSFYFLPSPHFPPFFPSPPSPFSPSILPSPFSSSCPPPPHLSPFSPSILPSPLLLLTPTHSPSLPSLPPFFLLLSSIPPLPTHPPDLYRSTWRECCTMQSWTSILVTGRGFYWEPFYWPPRSGTTRQVGVPPFPHLPYSLTHHSLPPSLTHSLTRPLALFLPHFLPSLPPSLPHSLTHPPTCSLSPSLPPFSPSLTHSLASLAYPHPPFPSP